MIPHIVVIIVYSSFPAFERIVLRMATIIPIAVILKIRLISIFYKSIIASHIANATAILIEKGPVFLNAFLEFSS